MTLSPAILFVCLGNICRSPLAEGALRAATEAAGLDWLIDSAGTSDWHVGSPPDSRAIATALANGVDISGQRARQIEAADFTRFTHIFALDSKNLADLKQIAPGMASAELALLLDIVPARTGQGVPDPYHSDTDAFAWTWRHVSEAADALVARLNSSAS
ncbi:MAG: low molecular weight phosphotyrosine protein phosphatase [Erythrobacter sp.]|nr:MAG: low molecular weight phosphotyrosine protein phosphatase [Erythrobacter sp.]